MRAFQPSAAFLAFFNQVIAAAEAPVTAGSYALVIPPFASPDENAFAQTRLRELIEQIDLLKRSVTPTTVNPYAIDPVTQQPVNPEAWGTSGGGP